MRRGARCPAPCPPPSWPARGRSARAPPAPPRRRRSRRWRARRAPPCHGWPRPRRRRLPAPRIRGAAAVSADPAAAHPHRSTRLHGWCRDGFRSLPYLVERRRMITGRGDNGKGRYKAAGRGRYTVRKPRDNVMSTTIVLGILAVLILPSASAQDVSLADRAVAIAATEQAAPEGAPATSAAALPAPAIAPPEEPADAGTRFVSLGRVLFIHNKWELTAVTQRTLDQAADYLTRQGRSRVLICVHADATGGVRANAELSGRRAAAVRDFLLKKGVAADQLLLEGHGEHAPIDENWTELGRARNRQVELFAIFSPSLATPPAR